MLSTVIDSNSVDTIKLGHPSLGIVLPHKAPFMPPCWRNPQSRRFEFLANVVEPHLILPDKSGAAFAVQDLIFH